MSESCCCLVVCPPPVSCYISYPHPLSLVTQSRMFPYKMFKICDVTMCTDEGTHFNINLDPAQFPAATSSLPLMGCDWVLHDLFTILRHSSMLMVLTASMVILNQWWPVGNIPQSDPGNYWRYCENRERSEGLLLIIQVCPSLSCGRFADWVSPLLTLSNDAGRG